MTDTTATATATATATTSLLPFECGGFTEGDEYDEYFDKYGIKVYADGAESTMEDLFEMKSWDNVLIIFHFTQNTEDEVNNLMRCDLSDTFTADATAVVCFAFNDDIVYGRGEKVCPLEEALLLTSGEAMEKKADPVPAAKRSKIE
jgi:hypothetical protein